MPSMSPVNQSHPRGLTAFSRPPPPLLLLLPAMLLLAAAALRSLARGGCCACVMEGRGLSVSLNVWLAAVGVPNAAMRALFFDRANDVR